MAALMKLRTRQSQGIPSWQEQIPIIHSLGTVQMGMEIEVHLLQV
jgi:hypothetical protein